MTFRSRLTLCPMATFLFCLVWSAALILSVSLFAMSPTWLSRAPFALAALVALRFVVYGPIEQRQRERE